MVNGQNEATLASARPVRDRVAGRGIEGSDHVITVVLLRAGDATSEKGTEKEKETKQRGAHRVGQQRDVIASQLQAFAGQVHNIGVQHAARDVEDKARVGRSLGSVPGGVGALADHGHRQRGQAALCVCLGSRECSGVFLLQVCSHVRQCVSVFSRCVYVCVCVCVCVCVRACV